MNNKITFATNTGAGTLEYIKLLLHSLKINLDRDDHEILVFVDGDKDEMVSYLKSQKSNFKDLKIVTHSVKPVVSYQRNSSLIVELAKHDIISYLHSDMVISKGYDTAILSELEDNMILSSTRIEPPLHPQSEITFTQDFGLNPENFDMESFNSYAESVKSNKNLEYFFAPYSFHKNTWKMLGGYDTLFRRAREDSDFVQRCIQLGVKLKQTFAANVYHFTCVSSRGKGWYDRNNREAQDRVFLQSQADIIELRRFIRKWGSFNHGESKLYKYDVDLFIHSEDDIMLQIAFTLEPHFSRVFLTNKDHLVKLKDATSHEHTAANKLLGFTDEDWQISKKFYNQTDYEQIYKLADGKTAYNACLYIHSTENLEYIYQNVQHLHKLIDGVEEFGDYEFGPAVLSIKNKVLVQNDLCVKNPEFDMSLLTIE